LIQTVKLEGWAELDAKLRQLKDGLGYDALKSSARAAGNVILAEMRSRVPYGRGDVANPAGTRKGRRYGRYRAFQAEKTETTLHKRWHMRDDLRAVVRIKQNGAEASIGPKWFAFLANFFERTGAKAHKITGDPVLFVPGQGFVRSVSHPGFSKRPFMLPAFMSKWRAALEEAKRVLAAKIKSLTGRA
jgi:hypothetical protein